MRWVFFSLLVLNVVYLVVSLVQQAPEMAAPAVALKELQAPATLTLIAEAQAEVTAGDSVSRVHLCPVIGPWSDVATAERALAQLRDVGYRGQLEQVQAVRERLHWVYIPGGDSREVAIRRLRELQSLGVDSFIVNEGADQNAISLGYYSNGASAKGVLSKMRAAGYPVEIRETAKTINEIWLNLEVDSIPDSGAALRKLLAANSQLSGSHASCQ